MAGEHLLEELGRFDGDAEILQAWRDGMAPEPTLLVSEWADRHRMLGSRDSAEPGPWRTVRTPYVQEVMGFSVARTLAIAATVTPEQVALAQVVPARVPERARALLEVGAILCLPTTPLDAPLAGLPLQQMDALAARIGPLTSLAGLAGVPQFSLPLAGSAGTWWGSRSSSGAAATSG